MKNLLFGLIAVGFISLSSFTTFSSPVKTTDEVQTVPCKWRDGIRVDGVWYWSEWTHGNCNVTDSGVLKPIE